jgi:hypothetical protein
MLLERQAALKYRKERLRSVERKMQDIDRHLLEEVQLPKSVFSSTHVK